MKVEDYIFAEADNACALCGHKELQSLTKHHIDENDRNNEYDNLIILCRNCHCRFHEKKGVSKNTIKTTKRRLIIKTLTHSGINALKISKRNNVGVIAMPFLLYHLVDLGLMTKEENQMGYGVQDDATARFAITIKGKKFYKKWLKI
jgi:predicted transcriptional regulator